MKKLLLLILMLICLPVQAKNVEFQNIFITDTTEAEEYLEPDNIVLKGYAEYLKDSDAIYLKDENNQFVLNLKVPQKITEQSIIEKRNQNLASMPKGLKPKYAIEDYKILSESYSNSLSAKGISVGTSYGSDIDYAQYEQKASIYTRYDNRWVALQLAYERTVGNNYGNYYDSLYIAPELKINKALSIKEVLSDNMTYGRKKAELILSIKPFAYKKDDRLNIELGTANVYSEEYSLIKSQLKFNTKFKL